MYIYLPINSHNLQLAHNNDIRVPLHVLAVEPDDCDDRLGRTALGSTGKSGLKAGPSGGLRPATTPDHTDGPAR